MKQGTGYIELVIFGRRINGELYFVRPFDFMWNFRKEYELIGDVMKNNIIVIDAASVDSFNGLFDGSIIYRTGHMEEHSECFGRTFVELHHDNKMRTSIQDAKARAERENERYVFGIGNFDFTKSILPCAEFIRVIEVPDIKGTFVQYPEPPQPIDLGEGWTTIASTFVPHTYIEGASLKLSRYSRDNVKSYLEIEDATV